MNRARKEPDSRLGYSTQVGVDGFPIDPNHPFNMTAGETLEEARAQFVGRELRRFKRGWKGGVAVALADATRFCRRFGIAPPDWIVQGVCALISGTTPSRRRGRGSHREDMKDFVRWDRVTMLEERLKSEGGWTSWDDCYWRVEVELEGEPEAGSEITIKKSYHRVKKRMRLNSGRYYLHW